MPSETCKVRLSCLKFSDQLFYPTNVASHFAPFDVIYKTSTCNDQGFVRREASASWKENSSSAFCRYDNATTAHWNVTIGPRLQAKWNSSERGAACRHTRQLKWRKYLTLYCEHQKINLLSWKNHHWILPSATSDHSTSSILTFLKICITFNLPFLLPSPTWSCPHDAFQPTDQNNPIYSHYCLGIFIYVRISHKTKSDIPAVKLSCSKRQWKLQCPFN